MNMRLRIHNILHAYTADRDGGFGAVRRFDNPQLLIEDGVIQYIGDDPVNNYDMSIDAGGCCLLPGFVDAHTHPVFSKTRESEFIMRVQGKDYEEIAASGGGIRNSARHFQQTPKSEIKENTRRRISFFLEYGTTTIEAKSGYGLSTEDEIKALEIINELNAETALEMLPTFLGAHEVPDDYRRNRKAYVDKVCEEMIPRVAERNLAGFCDVFTEKGVFDLLETRRILEAAARHGLKARIHADELHPFGGAELAAEMRALSADHLVEISDEGIRKMAEAGVVPILLPATTFFLRKEKYAPARKMIEAGCQVALATDFNPGSSMTQNMQLVWTIAALKMGLMPGELLWATSINPARSLEADNRIGCVEPGMQADLILMEIPNLEYLPYHFGINHVRMTMKRGKVVYKNPRMKGE